MEGLVEESSELMKEDFEDALLDAALIGAAQRVEPYEIAAYGTVRAFAEELGESEHASLLEETLEEEKETDEKLLNSRGRSMHRPMKSPGKRRASPKTISQPPERMERRTGSNGRI